MEPSRSRVDKAQIWLPREDIPAARGLCRPAPLNPGEERLRNSPMTVAFSRGSHLERDVFADIARPRSNPPAPEALDHL